jgi:CheY-like chemotaxis protein
LHSHSDRVSIDIVTEKKRILVAEDEPALQSVLASWLTRNGYDVLVASDGVEACDVADASRPDLALLDVLLPRRDGYAVLLHLRGRPATRDIPVIFLSAEAPERHRDIAWALGAQGFLSKPFPLEELLGVVSGALGGPVS